jgi:sugar phosphate permease
LLPLGDHEEDESQDRAENTTPPHPFDPLTLWQVAWQFARSGRFWFICFSIVFLTILMDFLTFIPIYLSEALQISSSQASMAGSTFPAGMFAALVLTSFVYDRLSKLRLIWTLGGLLTISCLCVLTLWNLQLVPESMRSPVAIGTIFLLGLSISPAYYIPMSVFAVAFGGKHSGFLVALIDVFGYCGALLFNFFGGSIAQHYGWSVFLSGLLTIAVLATACTVTFLTLDWLAQKRKLHAVSDG